MNLTPKCANCGTRIRVFEVFCADCQPTDQPEPLPQIEFAFYERWEAAR